MTQKKKLHANILFVYKDCLKKCRDHGLRLTVQWPEGAFRVHRADEFLFVSTDVFKTQKFVLEQAEKEKEKLGLK